MTGNEQLLVYVASGTEPTDPVRIQKGLFIFTQQAKSGHVAGEHPDFQFEPASFGPCDMGIYRRLRQLVADGLIEEIPVAGETWTRYKVTDKGQVAAQEIRSRAQPASVAYLESLRAWCDKQTFTSLLRAVYAAFPAYAAKSVLPHLRPNG